MLRVGNLVGRKFEKNYCPVTIESNKMRQDTASALIKTIFIEPQQKSEK